jgi:hypothetical protein
LDHYRKSPCNCIYNSDALELVQVLSPDVKPQTKEINHERGKCRKNLARLPYGSFEKKIPFVRIRASLFDFAMSTAISRLIK